MFYFALWKHGGFARPWGLHHAWGRRGSNGKNVISWLTESLRLGFLRALWHILLLAGRLHAFTMQKITPDNIRNGEIYYVNSNNELKATPCMFVHLNINSKSILMIQWLLLRWKVTFSPKHLFWEYINGRLLCASIKCMCTTIYGIPFSPGNKENFLIVTIYFIILTFFLQFWGKSQNCER